MEKVIDDDYALISSLDEINKLKKNCYILYNNEYAGFFINNNIKKLRKEYINYNDSVLEGINIMFKKNINYLPVLKNGKVLGVLKYESIMED
ncbi:hypothetical protein SAMN02745164_00656 [Marinitoga hydrogenitolerans DSM 16785]|uniref:CBS domain-containing protein n=1 Tax=Marinitoga hydrogenitolerans (strain DSM 16785 / JCM 12826 / AT1271) TaxID=1122195 RepID=A0A1M4UC88_MARH1|nr:CBS domain-containing protein [Marinitoga hydrogenitolerans]SHE54412.1 hypothetical protein SAMN02745164_00656 [Marinitoga hydrogenitolerans DSM 16785]